MESARDRILQFIDYKKLNKKQFYEVVGLSNGFLDKTVNPGVDKLDKILNAFPEINLYWLISGKGEMANAVTNSNHTNKSLVKSSSPLVITVDREGRENILFVPVKAAAGYLNGYGDADYIESLPSYRLPGYDNGNFRLFEVSGQSMFPTIRNKDKIVGEWSDLNSIKDNHVYVVVSKSEGIVVKRILNRLKQENILILKSDNRSNSEYEDIILSPDEIMELWSGIGKISTDFSEPDNNQDKLNDIEARLIKVEHIIKQV